MVYILWGDIVRYRLLTGTTEFWKFPERDTFKIDVNWDKELNAVTWLAGQIGAEYDMIGALLCPFHWRQEMVSYDTYFCSQLMGLALKRLGFLTHVNPGGLSPNSLHRLLQLH